MVIDHVIADEIFQVLLILSLQLAIGREDHLIGDYWRAYALLVNVYASGRGKGSRLLNLGFLTFIAQT